jgi:homoserine dehydrogenase
MSERSLALYEYRGFDWVRVYDQAAIDEASGVTELRQRIEQLRTLVETQEAVITAQREKLAATQRQLKTALEATNGE